MLRSLARSLRADACTTASTCVGPSWDLDLLKLEFGDLADKRTLFRLSPYPI